MDATGKELSQLSEPTMPAENPDLTWRHRQSRQTCSGPEPSSVPGIAQVERRRKRPGKVRAGHAPSKPPQVKCHC